MNNRTEHIWHKLLPLGGGGERGLISFPQNKEEKSWIFTLAHITVPSSKNPPSRQDAQAGWGVRIVP